MILKTALLFSPLPPIFGYHQTNCKMELSIQIEKSLQIRQLSDETSVPDGIAELSTSKLQIKEKTYSCNDCTYKSAIKHKQLEHKAKHKKDFFCEQCGTLFHSRKGKRIHRMSIHEKTASMKWALSKNGTKDIYPYNILYKGNMPPNFIKIDQ